MDHGCSVGRKPAVSSHFPSAGRGLAPAALPATSKSPLLVIIWNKERPWKGLIFMAKFTRGEAEVASSTIG